MKKIILTLILLTSILFTGCMALAPKGFVKQPAGWTTLPVSKRVNHSKAWNILVDQLGEKYEFSTMDSESGYLKTKWLDEDKIKTRITAKLNGTTAKIKVESQFFDDIEGKWIQGTNTETTKSIKDDLSGRFN